MRPRKFMFSCAAAAFIRQKFPLRIGMAKRSNGGKIN
jgi:hypothetical protein